MRLAHTFFRMYSWKSLKSKLCPGPLPAVHHRSSASSIHWTFEPLTITNVALDIIWLLTGIPLLFDNLVSAARDREIYWASWGRVINSCTFLDSICLRYNFLELKGYNLFSFWLRGHSLIIYWWGNNILDCEQCWVPVQRWTNHSSLVPTATII